MPLDDQFSLEQLVARILPIMRRVNGFVMSIARSGTDVPSEAVFHALDGHQFEIDGTACHVEVYGVYDDGGQRWVQLALADERQRMVTLRINARKGIECLEGFECALVSLAMNTTASPHQ